jgi:transcriptional regulator with XRE-family HTH domain
LLPGQQLREVRSRLRITTREVEKKSRKIADTESNWEFYISNARLTQIENKQSTPSIHKLYSLSIVYRIRFTDLLRLYGVDLQKIGRYQLATPLVGTHLAAIEAYGRDRPVHLPVRLSAGFSPERTNFVSRMVEVWGEVPLALIQHLNLKHNTYGYIGLEDYTLYPLIRPGSFVQIDEKQNTVRAFPWKNEFERPIYFVELRDGYACSWCELRERQLVLLPHPASGCSTRQFAYPTEAEIIGRVTAVAMRIVDYPASSSGHASMSLPKPQGHQESLI